MGNTQENLELLKQTGLNTYERLIELPLWDEYAAPLKSPIADLNNLGTREGQSTIAGKFLEHFTDYNWIHSYCILFQIICPFFSAAKLIYLI